MARAPAIPSMEPRRVARSKPSSSSGEMLTFMVGVSRVVVVGMSMCGAVDIYHRTRTGTRLGRVWSLQRYCGGTATTMFGALTLTGSGSKQHPLPTKSSPKPRPNTQTQPPTVNPLSRVAISLEYASLRYQSHCPLGMYVVPLIGDPSIWDAVLFIHQGEPCPARYPLYTKSLGHEATIPTLY